MGFKSFFSNLFGKKEQLKELRTSKTPLKDRIKQSSQKEYTGSVSINYEGKPLRVFTTTVKAHSRPHAATKMQNGLSLKVVSVKQNKSK